VVSGVARAVPATMTDAGDTLKNTNLGSSL
jgi:hypothetical protein